MTSYNHRAELQQQLPLHSTKKQDMLLTTMKHDVCSTAAPPSPVFVTGSQRVPDILGGVPLNIIFMHCVLAIACRYKDLCQDMHLHGLSDNCLYDNMYMRMNGYSHNQ